jgi:hypothetical protein
MVLQLYEGLSSEGLQANEQQFASSSEDDLAFTSNPARLMTMACERRRTLSRYKTHDGKVCRPRKTRVLTVMAGMWRTTRTRGSKRSRTSTRKNCKGKQKVSFGVSSGSDKEIRKNLHDLYWGHRVRRRRRRRKKAVQTGIRNRHSASYV